MEQDYTKQDYTKPELVDLGHVSELTAMHSTGAFTDVPFNGPVFEDQST